MKAIVIFAGLVVAFSLVVSGCKKPEDAALEKAAPKVENPQKEGKPAGFKAPMPSDDASRPTESK
jgi:hypothetical protein